MARIYSRKKGKAGSHKPPIKVVPKWVMYKKKQVEELVTTLAKQNYNSTMIGLILRDQYGIPDTKAVVGRSVTQIMKDNKAYPEFPEDMMNLFQKAVKIHGHLAKNKKDSHSKKGLLNTEAQIRRLSKYYKQHNAIPKDFEYDIDKVKLIVRK